MTDSSSSGDLEVHQLEKVFQPTGPTLPPEMFVDRGEVGKRFTKYLRMPGRPLCLTGPYRCGKTILARTHVQRQTERQIYLACKSSSTFDQLLIDAFDDLSPYYSQEVVRKTSKMPAGLSADFLAIKANIGAKGEEVSDKKSRVLPPQLTSRALAKFAAAADAPWIIDDAHKLPDAEVSKIAEVTREWQTLGLDTGSAKMIIIGTDQPTSSLHSRLIAAAPDLEQRVVSLNLQLMTMPELREIVDRGGRLLNVDFSAIGDYIAEYSFGFPNICHDLCFHVCDAAGWDMTQPSQVKATSANLQSALDEYVNLCRASIKEAFAENLGNPIAGLPRNFAKVVLDLLAAKKLDIGIPVADLVATVSKSLSVDADDARNGLTKLADEDKGTIRFENEIVYFKEPMYLVYYSQRAAAATKEPAQKALAAKFREVMKSSTAAIARKPA